MLNKDSIKSNKKIILLFVSLVLNGGFLFFTLGTKFDNSVWLPEENAHKKNKDYLYKEFTRGEDLVIAIDLGVDFFQPRFIAYFSKITKELEEEEGVVEVKNPLSATTIIQHNKVMQILSFEEALEQKIIPDLRAYKRRFTQSEYYGQLLSKDYQKLAIVVKIKAPLAEYNYERRDRIRKAARRILDSNLQGSLKSHLKKDENRGLGSIHWTGEVVLNHALAQYTQKNLALLLPILFVLLFLLLYFVFGRLLEVLVILYISLSVLSLSFAVFVLRGYPMTAISISLPILVLVIAIADAIHIFNRWYELSAKISNPKDALAQTVRETWMPCLLTSVTTAIGFGSFYFSELIPLRNFGEVSLIVILLAYLIIVSHSWLFIYFYAARLQKKNAELYPRLSRFLLSSYTSFSSRVPYLILAFFLLLIAVSIYGFRFIRTETNFLDVFFKKNSVIYQDFNYVDEELGGTGAVDILLRAKDKEVFKEVESLHFLEAAQKDFLAYKQTKHMRSYLTPLRMVHSEFAIDLGEKKNTRNLPHSKEQLAQELLFLEFSRGEQKNDVLSSYIDFDYTNSRIHLQTPNLNSSAAKEITLYIEEKLNKLGAVHRNKSEEKKGAPAKYEYTIAGGSIYFQILGDYIIDTQVLSILITLGIIWLLFTIEFRFKLATLGVLANTLPILLTCSIIIYLDIPFDFATVLISSVSFAMCVDDSIHFLHLYNIRKKELPDFDERIKHVISHIGQPIFFTSVLFSCGFIVFAFSDLVILIKFGIFTLLSLVFAFIANIIFLPAFLKLADSKSSKNRS